MCPSVLIVGGGLAGLSAARTLHRSGVDFQLREARQRLGGRILTVAASGEPSHDGFDLGPSWFWPGMQPAMAALVEELGLATFPQNDEGDVITQRVSGEAPNRYRGMRQEPQSMRLAGGTGTLVAAIAALLPSDRIRTGWRLTHVALRDNGIDARFAAPDGAEEVVRTSHIILALPPRLLAAHVTFAPAPSAGVSRRWRATPTWMAPHAKFFALYDRPFWRDEGLSGTAQSTVGPLGEIHDATSAEGEAALFGFVGLPPAHRRASGTEAIVSAAVRQLVALFGPCAATPRATLLKDWATDALTSTEDDWSDGRHPLLDSSSWVDEGWRRLVSLAGSETSRTEPGYLAGAVEAGQRAAVEAQRLFEGTDSDTPMEALFVPHRHCD